MNCRDFDQNWNQLLDARGRDDGDREQRLREHADACPSCLVRHRRFEALLRAIEAWAARPDASPAPSPGLAERVVVVAARPEIVSVSSGRSRLVRLRLAGLALASLAAAAALLAALGPWPRPEPVRRDSAASTGEGRSLGRGLLGGAVSDATAASWQLALLASEPAARLGKEMIGASFRPGSGSFENLSPPSGIPSLDADSFPPDLLNQMGDALAAGVRPLSTSARQAFGFLRAPTPDKLNRPAAPPAAKGA
jgi:hypothetical protein